MTSTIFPIRTQLPLDARIAGGNPDHLEVLSDFSDEEQRQQLMGDLANELAVSEGAYSAMAAQRIAEASTSVEMRTDGRVGAMVTLRALGLVRRPSLRIAGITLAHLCLSTELEEMPEGPILRLRISPPLVHRNSYGNRTEAFEGVLHHLLDQFDGALSSLIAATGMPADALVVPQLPSSCPLADFVAELSQRIFARFYTPLLTPTEQLLAAPRLKLAA